ncbi:hypothetical protein C823_003115 [Eubacterium plexicaudatum ASF492]|nr:hypothetical protein C823_003115 [Eubacterium plexicaudatum ASF492]
MSDVKIQWHSGFAAAIELELADNRPDLTYMKEYNLNSKPLEIDLLVIKKTTIHQLQMKSAKFSANTIF